MSPHVNEHVYNTSSRSRDEKGPLVRRASAAAASRSCRRCSMDMTCAPSNRRPRLLKTCGTGSDPQSTVRTVGAARRRRACLQAGSLLGCVRSTTARCVVSCAGSRSSMERCPRRFASTAALHTALSDELSTPHMDGTVSRLAVRAASRAQRLQLHAATATTHATTPRPLAM